MITKTIVAALVMSGCTVLATDTTYASGNQCGVASWYASGTTTASGEHMNAGAMTAAHKTLPFGTIVKVTDQKTGRSVKVRINDRGPFVKGRIIDLTRAAAHSLGVQGIAKVCIAAV